MASRAQRKRRKKERMITLAGGGQVAPRSQALPRVHAVEKDRDPAMHARAKRQAHLRALGLNEGLWRLPMAGCEVGLSLLADRLQPDERAALWEAVCHIRRVYVAYGKAIGAPDRYAQCLRILLPATQFEIRADSAPRDDRPQADRDIAAVSAFMRVQGWLMRGSAADLSACVAAVVDLPDGEPVRDWPAVKRALGLVSAGLRGTTA